MDGSLRFVTGALLHFVRLMSSTANCPPGPRHGRSSDVDVLHPEAVEYLHPMEQKRYRPRLEILQGTLDMLVLQTLQWGPQHGYAIGQTIRTESAESLKIETGSLYPALHRLEKQGWVKAEWKQTEANQRAKFYRLTPTGKKQLLQERDRWSQLVEAIGTILNPRRTKG